MPDTVRPHRRPRDAQRVPASVRMRVEVTVSVYAVTNAVSSWVNPVTNIANSQLAGCSVTTSHYHGRHFGCGASERSVSRTSQSIGCDLTECAGACQLEIKSPVRPKGICTCTRVPSPVPSDQTSPFHSPVRALSLPRLTTTDIPRRHALAPPEQPRDRRQGQGPRAQGELFVLARPGQPDAPDRGRVGYHAHVPDYQERCPRRKGPDGVVSHLCE